MSIPKQGGPPTVLLELVPLPLPAPFLSSLLSGHTAYWLEGGT